MAQPSSAASAPNVQVAALQERLNEKLKHTTAFCDLPLGHEQAIRIVDTDYFECVCCPAPRMHSNGELELGRSYSAQQTISTCLCTGKSFVKQQAPHDRIHSKRACER